MELKIKQLDPELPVPSYAYDGDAAFDLYARETMEIKPGERIAMPSGVAMAIPAGYAGLVWDKGGISNKGGVKVLGGVFDTGYRGEVIIGLINLSQESYLFERGHKMAQMLIQKIEHVDIKIVDSLDDTERGENRFGSSGK